MKNLTRIMLLLSLVYMTQACNDVLDNPQPSTALSTDIALNDPGAVAGQKANMYGRFHDREESTRWMLAPAAAADLTDIRPSAGRFDEYNRNDLRTGFMDSGAYGELYDIINDANILIGGIPDDVLDDATLQQFQGEAYFIRALAMHHMVRTLGYEPGMTPNAGQGAGFNLGIILRTEPVLDLASADLRSRSTVGEVYTQIEADIQQAINLLDNSTVPFLASRAAAYALSARVNLYQRDWAAAEQAATNALNESGASLAGATAADVEAIFDETASSPEHIFVIDTDPATESAGVNQALSAYTSMQWMAQIPTQKLIDMYPAGDVRLDAWYGPCENDVQNDAPVGNCVDVNNNNWEIKKYDAEQGQFADDYIHFRAAEMVLIQAEARLEQGNIAGATTALNSLRQARGNGALAGVITLDDIFDERARELVAEGHRYFDHKRRGFDIPKPDGSVLPFTDLKILDDIPPTELEVNPNLTQNPGY